MTSTQKKERIEAVINRLRGIPIPSQELEDVLADFVRDELTTYTNEILEEVEEKIRASKTVKQARFGMPYNLAEMAHEDAKDEDIQVITNMKIDHEK